MIQDLIPNDTNHVKALPRIQAVHEHVSVYANKVLRIEYTILILPRGVDNLRGKLLTFVLDRLTECVFNGRIVALDKMTVDKLDCQGRFACLLQGLDEGRMLDKGKKWKKWTRRTNRPAADDCNLA